MRHKMSGRKLHIDTKHRTANFKNMVTSLILFGKIRTTEPRAKEIRRIADHVINLGKKFPPSALEGLEGADAIKSQADRLHAIRMAHRWIRDRSALTKVFTEYAERFKDRPGGYTRLIKVGRRPGDNAPMNIVELVEAMGSEMPVVEPPVEGQAPEAPVAE